MHLWDGGGGDTDVHKGQVRKEEVHGGVEVGIWADGQDDEQVSKYSVQAHGKEKPKYEGLQYCSFEKLRRNSEIPVWFLSATLVVEVTQKKKKKEK